MFLTHFKYRVPNAEILGNLRLSISSDGFSCIFREILSWIFLRESQIYRINLLLTFYILLMFYCVCTVHVLKTFPVFFFVARG